jgi:hypothetical protein
MGAFRAGIIESSFPKYYLEEFQVPEVDLPSIFQKLAK